MKLVVALVVGAAVGAAATRFVRPNPRPALPPAERVPSPTGRVTVDVSGAAD